VVVHSSSHKPFFYGWVIAGIAALVAFSSGPGQSYTFSVFIDSMILDLGLSRTDISVLYAVGTGFSATMVIIVSRLADKYGPKIMIVLTATCLFLACVGMAFALSAIAFFVAFSALRAFGQGSTSINATLITAQWFVRMRGRAMAVMGLGFAVSMAFMPIMSRILIDIVGWRIAYVFLGAFIWLLVVPISIIVLRNTPEEIGLHPDGDNTHPEGETGSFDIVEKDNRKVLTSPTFWGLALPLATPSFVSTALIFHQAAIFLERGISSTMAAAAFLPISVSAIFASLLSGFLVDRVGPKKLFYGSMTVLVLSIAILGFGGTSDWAILYAVMLGASNGSGQIVSNVLWAHYYGRRKLGRVQGSANMVTIAGSALGPLPLAIMQGLTEGFVVGVLLMGVLPVGAVLALFLVNTNNIQQIE